MSIATRPCARRGFVARGPRIFVRFDSALRKWNIAGWSGGLRADVWSFGKPLLRRSCVYSSTQKRESCEPLASLCSAWTHAPHADRPVTAVSGQNNAIHAWRCCTVCPRPFSYTCGAKRATRSMYIFPDVAPPARRFVATAVVGLPVDDPTRVAECPLRLSN